MGKTSMIHAIVDQYSHCEWVENSMSANENNLIWIDLEMTGLDPERDRIIEIATLVTDANLNILAELPDPVRNSGRRRRLWLCQRSW